MNLLAICCFLCHHSLLMLIVFHAFFFMQNSVSVYVHFDFSFFFCVVTWLFSNQLIIIVLCSFDSRQFPEINVKKKKNNNRCSQHMAGDALRVAASQQQRTLRTTQRSERLKPSAAQMIHLISLAHPFSITSMSSFIVLKVVSFPFKWSPERSCSSLPFTYRSLCKCVLAAHPCNKRRRVENVYWKGAKSSRRVKETSFAPPPQSLHWWKVFVRVCSQMRFCTRSIWPGYEPLNGCSTCSHSPFLHRPYFVQMGLHRAGH